MTTRYFFNETDSSIAKATQSGNSIDFSVWPCSHPECIVSWRSMDKLASASLKAFRTDPRWKEITEDQI